MIIRREPRVPKPGDYRFDNAFLQDARLSYRARGVMAFLLTCPEGDGIDSATIAESAKEGRDAVRVALNELEKFGYIRREKQPLGEGRWRTLWWIDRSVGMPV